MNLIRIAIERPIAILAGVAMVIMFGAVALQSIPIQLAPDVNRPIITVETRWPGAAPAEVEREIVNLQEEELKGLDGLVKMTSRSRNDEGEITLEFNVGADMSRSLLLVANRLDRVDGYPAEADQPVLDTSAAEDSPIAWFHLRAAPGNNRAIWTYREFVEDIIQDRIERVPGVSRVNVFGGVEREMQISVNPNAMAQYGITVPDMVASLRAANASVSAGDINEGKRRYVVRTEGDFETLDQVREVIIRSEVDEETGRVARVTVGDIAQVEFGFKESTARIRQLGEPSIAFNAVRETGANVIETMAGIAEAVDELNANALPNAGLVLTQVYDETIYINSAIDLVQQNILFGGLLAGSILLLFLRSWRPTLIVSLAIPVSIIGSFVAMAALGRSINVISLAGLAFAVGMVVDAAIVVLENIFRLRQRGLSAREAAYQGTSQVWGAVLVSSLTTVMVFIPILVMELEVGQLFRDIAVAISVSVVLSLIVAVTVIPALGSRLLRRMPEGKEVVRLPVIDPMAAKFKDSVVGLTKQVISNRPLAIGVVVGISGLAAVATWAFLPKLEYLPEGNRNLIFGVALPPPGYNLDTSTEIAEKVESATRHLWARETGPEAEPGEPPKMQHFFFVALRTQLFFGSAATDDQASRVSELIPVVGAPIFEEPGTFGFITQPSLFGRGIGGGRSIDLDISGPDLPTILDVAQRAANILRETFPPAEGHQFRPQPGLELGAPEVRLIPDPLRLADNGLNTRDFGATIDAFNDGLRVAEITVGGERIDLTLRGENTETGATQDIGNLPVVTREGRIVPAASLADVQVTAGPTEIRHRERLRTVTLEVRPSNALALEAAMEILQRDVIDRLSNEGVPAGINMRLSGTADQLTETWNEIVLDLLIALIIVYLVMAVLFESFWYPLIIMVSVPLATAGGIGGLAVLNLFTLQQLDMLTMLGFVILVGIVVNNAILLVHQTLHHLRHDGMGVEAAIIDATTNRIRPIFMSSMTSIFGILPLVLFPGAGSELYRGLGSVVLGGLSLSAVLTLAVIPPLLGLVAPLIEGRDTTADAGGTSANQGGNVAAAE
ncbi:MAG: efflux RND transporter permease subunit [Alphaproteobacteria bacterium]|nr:efflux RND transporter permease subunit [Alphaproteobacteria bacterium SS10]